MESAAEASDHRRSSYGRGYWLRRCEGFVVESAGKRIGRVVGIRYGTSQDEPEALALRAGRVSRRLVLLRVDDVAEIVAAERRILVADSPRLTSE